MIFGGIGYFYVFIKINIDNYSYSKGLNVNLNQQLFALNVLCTSNVHYLQLYSHKDHTILNYSQFFTLPYN